LYGC